MIINNTNEAMKLAKTAGEALTQADKSGAKGEAYAIAALVGGWNSFEFSYTVERKKDEYDAPVSIGIADLFTDPRNADGSIDKKAVGARKMALARQFFGIEAPTNAQLSVINRALLAARYLTANKATVKIVAGKLSVPYGLIEAAPKDNASSKAKLQYEVMKDKPVTIDGKEGMSLNALRNQAVKAFPVKTRAGRTAKADEGTSLASSIKLVRATLESQLNSDGESNVALTESLRRELYLLTQSAAAYFSADPIGDDIGLDANKVANF